MKHLWLTFLVNALSLALATVFFGWMLKGQGWLWWFAMAAMGLLWLLWLIDGALLLVVALLEWRGRRAR